MFLKVEDLSSQKDAAAQGNRAHGVQRQSKRSKAWHERSGGQVKARDHGQHHQKALCGREVFPVRRDKKQYTRGHHDGAERDREHHRPSHAGRFTRGLESPNAFGGLRIEKFGYSLAAGAKNN